MDNLFVPAATWAVGSHPGRRAVSYTAVPGGIPFAALLPLILLAVGFVGFCLYDLSRSEVRYLPKWAWALICLLSIPIGGIVYLLVGREHR